MRRLAILSCGLFFVLSACGEKPTAATDEMNLEGEASLETQQKLSTDGRIVMSSLPKVFEPNACILPITIRNGTDDEVVVSMMQFSVTGTGEADSGNMFAQTILAGETNTARILFPTRQCDELLEITAPNLTCKQDGGDCSEAVEFEAGEALLIKRQ